MALESMKSASNHFSARDSDLARLLACLQATHDREIMGQIYDLTKDYVYAVAYVCVQDPTVAADLRQAAYFEFVGKYASIRTPVALRAWFKAVIKHRVREVLGRHAERIVRLEHSDWLADLIPSEQTPLDILIDKERSAELAALLNEGVAKLPSRYSQCLELLFLHGVEPAVVAHQLRISTETVYQYKARALVLLAQQPRIKAWYERMHY